jgi:ABC-2 type transport system permease protein
MMSVGTRTGRLRVGLSAAIREFFREPINLALLVALPPIIVTTYGEMMSAFPQMPYMSTAPDTLGAMAGTLFVAAFLPGVIGLFQVISARRADERLSLTGFPRATLFGARLLAVLVASLLTAAISLAVLTTQTEVGSLAPAFFTLAFVGILYGLVGMLIGAVLPRELEGSLVLIFFADVDEALASGIIQTDSVLTKLFPLHYPHELFTAAVEGTSIAQGDALAAAGYALALLVVTLGVYVTLTGEGGVLG